MLQRNIVTLGLVFICCLLLLGGCSDGEDVESDLKDTLTADEDSNLAVRTLSGSVIGALDAVQAPLIDLNIKRQEIPEYLQKISGKPYAVPSPLQCKIMKEELATLDGLLGPDMQGDEKSLAAEDGDTDYVSEGASMIQSHAIGFVAGKASILPLRGVIRHITGASDHAKDVSAAYETGKLRRAYIKGLTLALKCDKPAAATAKKTAPKPKQAIELSENTAK